MCQSEFKEPARGSHMSVSIIQKAGTKISSIHIHQLRKRHPQPPAEYIKLPGTTTYFPFIYYLPNQPSSYILIYPPLFISTATLPVQATTTSVGFAQKSAPRPQTTFLTLVSLSPVGRCCWLPEGSGGSMGTGQFPISHQHSRKLSQL